MSGPDNAGGSPYDIEQPALFSPVPAPVPDLASYDILLASISGGKDSQTMLRALVQAADAAGARDRIVAVFCDLGDEDEWPGTRELAVYHAAHYGVRFEIMYRQVENGDGSKRHQGLSEYIEVRGKWPTATQRYCTSDTKRAPIYRLMTRLAAEQRAAGAAGQVRILNPIGMRAGESPRRALMAPFFHDQRASNGRRRVDVWLPIHSWTTAEVWADIRRSGVRYHPVYDKGMPRLSCRFCVLASRSALIRAAQLDPEGARRRAAMEERMGHTFQNGRSMADIIKQAEAASAIAVVDDWSA